MANRHLSRSIALQTLFEWDFNNRAAKDIDNTMSYVLDEFGPGLADTEYIETLVKNLIKKQKPLDSIIEKAAPDWPIEKISVIDRNVLRIGLYELLYGDRKEVPPKVAINEAIELGKAFGGENSGKFVNGVLGTVYKEMGSPGKDDVSPKKDVDPKKLPKEYLGGALVFRKDKDGKILLAFVHDVFGYWTISKGHIEQDENIQEGTRREIKEELGIDTDILEQIGENEYTAQDPEKGKIRKNVQYFIAHTETEKLTLGDSGGLDDARWFSLEEVPDLRMYGDIVPIVTKGIGLIKKYKK